MCTRLPPCRCPEAIPGPCIHHRGWARDAGAERHTRCARSPVPSPAPPPRPGPPSGRPAPHLAGRAAGGVVPSPTPAGLGRPPIPPRRRPPPQRWRRVRKVHHAPGMARAALFREAPQPATALTEPDHLGRAPDPRAHGCEPETRREGLPVPQDRSPPTLRPPRHALAGACALLAQARPHADGELAPAALPLGRPALGTQRHHDPIGTQRARPGPGFSDL
jgi:hypothetical protein